LFTEGGNPRQRHHCPFKGKEEESMETIGAGRKGILGGKGKGAPREGYLKKRKRRACCMGRKDDRKVVDQLPAGKGKKRTSRLIPIKGQKKKGKKRDFLCFFGKGLLLYNGRKLRRKEKIFQSPEKKKRKVQCPGGQRSCFLSGGEGGSEERDLDFSPLGRKRENSSQRMGKKKLGSVSA